MNLSTKKIEDMSEEELFSIVPYNKDKADDIADIGYSYWKSVLYNFTKRKGTMFVLGLFVLLVLATFLCPIVGKYKYSELVPNTDLAFISPNSEYWFGTDNIGRDYFCQVWAAARTSICLAIVVSAGQIILGVLFGLIWGYVKRLDNIFSFAYNVISNVPSMIYLTLISFVIGKSFTVIALTLIFLGWLGVAMSVRNMVLMLREREFNVESRLLGTPTRVILVKNLLPQLISVLILSFTLSIPATIATESTLSFLGLGLGTDMASLGLLLQSARAYFMDYPYLLIIPSIIVSLITLTFYMVGNAFADASDPKNHR